MAHWYDHAIIYQIYPKSFQDSNGDGVGDLNGIRKRIPYLKNLGVNAVWLNPVFVSPQVDNGYDVSNYFAIDPHMGTMEDMENLIKDLHKAGIHLIMDFVLNHTSDQHPWFQDAIRTPIAFIETTIFSLVMMASDLITGVHSLVAVYGSQIQQAQVNLTFTCLINGCLI